MISQLNRSARARDCNDSLAGNFLCRPERKVSFGRTDLHAKPFFVPLSDPLSISWRLNLRNMIVSATFNIELIDRRDCAHPRNETLIALDTLAFVGLSLHKWSSYLVMGVIENWAFETTPGQAHMSRNLESNFLTIASPFPRISSFPASKNLSWTFLSPEMFWNVHLAVDHLIHKHIISENREMLEGESIYCK